ncbi:MAG TPA: glycosyltransferase family 2 protein [Acidobacteriaceae bacterium]|jgi:GT2 family glycosyltransferase|nr:glycosyltransferase family 2 protein [Acidobacteriaceae bacterium]
MSPAPNTAAPDVSILIVSLNTRDVLRRCLKELAEEIARTPQYSAEIFVVDNNSRDGSPAMVREEFAGIKLIETGVNLGFAGANNVAMRVAGGRYILLLNSDAFLQSGSLRLAVEHMDANPNAGLGGARLIGEDGAWQPSARMFPTPLHEMITYAGLAAKFPESKFFGRGDRTWADPLQPAAVDWVPGAFMIIRKTVLDQVGLFDENFFLYYEEVDLCRRIRAAGHQIWYWPDIVVVHIGGESSRQMGHMSVIGSQLTLWRMRAMLLYFRKHHGSGAGVMRALEGSYYRLRAWHNRHSHHPEAAQRAAYSTTLADSLHQAWQETKGGRISPPQPW